MKYEIDESNHQDWLNTGTWYNTSICSRLNWSLFAYFITHARTDRYDLICSLFAHDIKQPYYEYEEISIGDRLITKHVTTEALWELGANLNFLEIWLKRLEDNYEIKYEMYNKAMKDMFKQIPTKMNKALIPKEKVHKLMTEIGGGWYMENFLRDYHH